MAAAVANFVAGAVSGDDLVETLVVDLVLGAGFFVSVFCIGMFSVG